MNHCTFSGRLTKDASLRYTQSGKAVCNFTLAVDSGFGDNKRTEFINCILWQKEKLAPYLLKGKALFLSGEYTERKYQDKDGIERRIVEINVRDIEFQQGQPAQAHGQQSNQANQQQQQQTQYEQQYFPSEATGMDDVPF